LEAAPRRQRVGGQAVRFADVIFRGGHLSERALIEAVMSGDRPAHLDRCDICAERAVDLGRWLDDVRKTGNDAVDVAFPPERMLAQQQQILRKLEQLDQPARVIAFPSATKLAREMGGRRVAAGWLGVAAAAGVVLGVVSSQFTTRFTDRAQGPESPNVTRPAGDVVLPEDRDRDLPPTGLASASEATQPRPLFEEVDRPIPSAFEAMASMTPRAVVATPISLRTPVVK
jgi:hypothetical protein